MVDELDSKQVLSSTAHWTAAVRAAESARPDRLFDDPWADALAGEQGRAWIEQRSPESVLPMTLRTRFFDDFLQHIAAESEVRQIVLMAAGLDTRAFRMRWPAGTRLFELDQPSVLAYKEGVLRAAGAMPTCERHSIGVDLVSSWEGGLRKAGFDSRRAAGWVLEGFLFYLSTENMTRLLDRVLALGMPGSYVGFDIVNSITLTSPLTRSWVEMQAASGAPWLGTMDDPAGFLADRHWHATLTPLGSPQANYGRWPGPVIPATIPGMPHLWFVTGQKA